MPRTRVFLVQELFAQFSDYSFRKFHRTTLVKVKAHLLQVATELRPVNLGAAFFLADPYGDS